MLIQQLATEISFPSSTELMLGAVAGTIAGFVVLIWIDRYSSRGDHGKGQNLSLKKRT